MAVQDIIIAVCQWVFVLALLFSVFRRERMEWTGPITAIGLSIIAVVFASMGFWHSTASCGVTAICWWIIGVRAVVRRMKEPRPVSAYNVKFGRKGKEPWAL